MSDARADVGAEQALIGAVLNGSRLDGLDITPSDFWQPRHEAIWRAMLRVHEAGNTIDPTTVRVALDQTGAKVDPTYLIELMTSAPIAIDPAWHADRIVSEARFRDLASAAMKIKVAADNPSLDLADARDLARQAIDEATSDGTRTTHVRVSDVLPSVLDIAQSGTAPALSTPWPDVDRLITGLAPGRLVVVGARPGVGKSLMGTNLALHFAHHHRHAVLVASLEMPREEVVQRLVAAKARVDLTKLSSGTTTDAQWQQIAQHHDAINDLPITIEDNATQTVTSIRAAARDVLRERDDLALIVVDYLQLMRAPEAAKGANRVEVLGEISRGLKVLAREMGACVVAMAQVNRQGIQHGDGRPKMSDLRESGSIEADADQVILLHRPSDDTPDVEVLVDKNRWGPKGMATLHIQGHYARLANQTWSPAGAIA